MLTVLAESDGFVAVAKPPGRIVIPGRGTAGHEVPLRDEVSDQLGRRLLVVHRLDRDTSGVLLLATDPAAHRALSRAFERHLTVKRYWALVRGAWFGAGEIDRPLVPIRGGRVRAGDIGERGAKPSRTTWRAVERLTAPAIPPATFTVAELRPLTGRLHQVRAHLQAAGHPLAVDPDYGGAVRLTRADLGLPVSRPDERADGPVLGRTPLHALSLKFPHPTTGAPVTIEAPLADDLAQVVALLRGDGRKTAPDGDGQDASPGEPGGGGGVLRVPTGGDKV